MSIERITKIRRPVEMQPQQDPSEKSSRAPASFQELMTLFETLFQQIENLFSNQGQSNPTGSDNPSGSGSNSGAGANSGSSIQGAEPSKPQATQALKAPQAPQASQASQAPQASQASQAPQTSQTPQDSQTQQTKPTQQVEDTQTAAPTATATATATSPTSSTSGSRATSLDELNKSFDPKSITFVPIRSTEEARKNDAKIHNAHDFANAVDEAAARYGIPPELLRSQVQAESWGMGNASNPNQYLDAMNHRGDLDRGDNASRGLLQVSGNFLDGGAWSGDGPNNSRVGGKSVSRADYDSSITLQLDVGAANLAQRIADGGSLTAGLSSYFSGSFDTSKATDYLKKIDDGLRDDYAQNL